MQAETLNIYYDKYESSAEVDIKCLQSDAAEPRGSRR